MNTTEGWTTSNSQRADAFRPYLPFVCALLVFFIAEFVLQRFGAKVEILPISDLTNLAVDEGYRRNTLLAVDEGSRRNTLLALATLWLVSILALTAAFLYEVWTNRTSSHWRGWLIFVLLLPILLAIGYIYLSKESVRFDLVYAFIGGEAFFERVISSIGEGSGWGTIDFDLLNFGLSILAGATIGTVAAGCVSATILGLEGDIDTWKLQVSRLQRYIYFGAALFVVGVLCGRYAFSYPDYMLGPEFLPRFTALVNALLAYLGIEYALVLASLAISSLVLLQAAGKKLARGALTDRAETQRRRRANEPVWVPAAQPRKGGISEANVANYMKRKAMVVSTGDVLKTIVALLAPALTGVIASQASLPLPGG